MLKKLLWSPFTRFLHWAIALPVLVNFFSEGGEWPHEVLGYVALGGALSRIIWGFFSNDQSNFKYFPLNPNELKSYIKDSFRSENKDYSGHNPIASLAYLLIWTCVIALGVSGFMMDLDAFWGEEWLEETHESISHGLVSLILLHIIGLIIDGKKFRRRTWLGMITGKR